MIKNSKKNKIKLGGFVPMFSGMFYILKTVTFGDILKVIIEIIAGAMPIIGVLISGILSLISGTSTVNFSYDNSLINCDTDSNSSICAKSVYKAYYYTDSMNTVKVKIKINDSNNKFKTKKTYLMKRVCNLGFCNDSPVESTKAEIVSNDYEFSIDVSNYKNSEDSIYVRVELCKDQEQCKNYDSIYIKYASSNDINGDNPYNANKYSAFDTNVKYKILNIEYNAKYDDFFSNYYIVGNNTVYANAIQTIIDETLINDIGSTARCVLLSGIYAQLFSGDGKSFTKAYTVDGKTYQYDSDELTTKFLNSNSFSKNQPWFKEYAVSGTNSAGTKVEFVKDMAMTKAKFLGTIRDQIKNGEASAIPLYVETTINKNKVNALHVVTAIGISKTGMNKTDEDLDFSDILIMDNTLSEGCSTYNCFSYASPLFYLTTLNGDKMKINITNKCPDDSQSAAPCKEGNFTAELAYPYKIVDFSNAYGGFYLSYDLK